LLFLAAYVHNNSIMAESNSRDSKRVVEHWHLEDVEVIHKQHPDTFHLASLEERRGLVVGRRVRLHFAFDKSMSDNCRAERMWVTITEKDGDHFVGLLENEPVYIKNLSVGSPIEFAVSNIAQILIPKTDPRWPDTKLAVVSKRVFESRRVGFLHRERPRNAQDSGWAVWDGSESEAFNADGANYKLISLEQLLEIDKSVEPLLKAEVGAVFERSPDSQEFQRVYDWKPAD
jgi:hypothetical protein